MAAATRRSIPYKLVFRFTTDAGILAPLNEKSWTVDQVDFVSEYFPNWTGNVLGKSGEGNA